MKRVLVTGGAGFIGSEIVKKLSEKDEYDITVLDNLLSQIHGQKGEESYLYNLVKDKCNFVKGDVRNYQVIEALVDKCDYIIHLAAETGTGQSMYQINRYNDVNIMGTSNILQAISNKGKGSPVKKIILSSSRSVYGEGMYKCGKCGIVYPKAREKARMVKGDFGVYCDKCGSKVYLVPTTEESRVTPNSLYAFTKFAQEEMLRTMCPSLGIDYTIFRFQNVYGVGQSLKNPYTGIPILQTWWKPAIFSKPLIRQPVPSEPKRMA